MSQKTSANTAKEQTVDPGSRETITELAIRAFDWFYDSENTEIFNNRPAFGVERLRRALDVPAYDLVVPLQLLLEQGVMDRFTVEPVRNRKIHTINKEWLAGGSRERLLRILIPQPYVDTYVPFGPARMLQTTHANIDGILMTFKEGDVIRDESIIRVLPANVLAKLSEDTIVMCADRHCQHRFDLSESVASDVPVFEVLKMAEVQINHDGRMWFYPGDWVKDSAHRYFLAKPDMREQYKDVLKEVPSKQYTCCPKCKNLAKRPAAQPEKTVDENQNTL